MKTRTPNWVIILLVIFFGTSVYLGYKYYMLTSNPNQVATLVAEQAQKTAEAEIAALVADVSKLMILPTDETPTIATVADPSLLKDQPFFANALKEDKVLIYAKAKKAILYRPSIERIIEVAPIFLGDEKSSQTAPQKQVTPVKEDATTSKTSTSKTTDEN